MLLHTVIPFSTTDTKEMVSRLNSILGDTDMDFNGFNGEDFTSNEALNNGFKSDMDYITDRILKEDEITRQNGGNAQPFEVIKKYLRYFFRQVDYYLDWDYSVNYINDTIVLVVAYITD